MSLATNIRKTVSKYKSPTFYADFSDDVPQWISLGNFALNIRLSGSYYNGFRYGRTSAIGGEQQSGKSLLAATAAREAQKRQNAFVIWADVEHATEEAFLERAGVDISPENFLYLEMAAMEDLKRFIADLVKEKKRMNDDSYVFICVDSYNGLMTDSELERMDKGEMHNDQGQKAKQLKSVIGAIQHLIARQRIHVTGIVHSMQSQDKYNPDEIQTGGRGVQYYASQVLNFTKLKLKAGTIENPEIIDEYDDAKKIAGIRCMASIYKSRFAKPNERIEIQVPWPHGVDAYSGLFDFMLDEGVIAPTKPGSTYYHYTGEGYDEKFFKKDFRSHADRIMELDESVREPHRLEEVDG